VLITLTLHTPDQVQVSGNLYYTMRQNYETEGLTNDNGRPKVVNSLTAREWSYKTESAQTTHSAHCPI